VLLAVDVVVQGHRRGAEAGRDGGHRHRGEALLVRDRACRVDDVGAREARWTWHRSPFKPAEYMPYTYEVRRLAKVGLVSSAAVSAVAFTAVVALSGGDIGYALRVITHGQSSTDDIEWKRHVTIPAESPTRWTGRDRCGDVQEAAGGSLDAALLPGGATQLVVIRHGELICQWAAPGHRIDELRPVFSISKTVTALLLSRAVEAGKMSWEEPITHWIPELGERDHRFAGITLADLVDMRSGIGFRVVAGFPWFNEDAPRVYYASDLEAATLDRPAIESAPGPFTYNDWAPNLLSIAYRRATGHLMIGPDATQLWSSLGAQHSAQWLVDGHGFPWQESGFVASAPDIARIGQLLLDDRTSDFARRSAAAPVTGIVIVRLGNSGYEKVSSEPQIAAQLEHWARRL
jgi:Beta-lactamase